VPLWEWVISRICEEFNCLPTEAMREMEEAPTGMIKDILELREYSRAKQIIDNAQKEEDIPSSPVIDMVFEIEATLIKERKNEQRYVRNIT
jgi:tRNA isopentenyl-2-thiomethyl-A-37 hydroxylase MiaE